MDDQKLLFHINYSQAELRFELLFGLSVVDTQLLSSSKVRDLGAGLTGLSIFMIILVAFVCLLILFV